jgi:hypoxanthine-guanine phosphoribosyltransferase
MKIYTLGIATVSALLISQLSGPLPATNIATSSYKLDQATFSLEQTNSMLAFEIDDKDPLAVDRILVDGFELTPDQNGI